MKLILASYLAALHFAGRLIERLQKGFISVRHQRLPLAGCMACVVIMLPNGRSKTFLISKYHHYKQTIIIIKQKT
jgi:hypothetical protein